MVCLSPLRPRNRAPAPEGFYRQFPIIAAGALQSSHYPSDSLGGDLNALEGLLVSAETEEQGQLVYRMTSYAPVQSPCPADGRFALPSGEILHTSGE